MRVIIWQVILAHACNLYHVRLFVQLLLPSTSGA